MGTPTPTCPGILPGGYSDLSWTGVCRLSLKTLTQIKGDLAEEGFLIKKRPIRAAHPRSVKYVSTPPRAFLVRTWVQMVCEKMCTSISKYINFSFNTFKVRTNVSKHMQNKARIWLWIWIYTSLYPYRQKKMSADHCNIPQSEDTIFIFPL